MSFAGDYGDDVDHVDGYSGPLQCADFLLGTGGGGVRGNLPTSLHLPLLSFGQGERNDFLPLIRVLEASDGGVRVHVARGFVEQLDNSYFSVDAAFEGTFFSPKERGSVTNGGGRHPS